MTTLSEVRMCPEVFFMYRKKEAVKSQSFHLENFRRRGRYTFVFLTLLIAMFAILILNINIGSVPIGLNRILKILAGQYRDSRDFSIIWQIRMPRILAAAILGGGLSVSGFLLQTFFGNPIAGPYVLGISSGAKMFVALGMIFSMNRFLKFTSGWLIFAAFCGSMAVTGFILLISAKIKHMASLLVAGIMAGYICSAVTDFVVTFAEDSDIVNLHGWTRGSFSGILWSHVGIAAVIVGICCTAVFLLSKPIGAYQLGEGYAQSLGVNVRILRLTLILLSSILSACVTALAGPVSFVGIAVPQLVKRSLNTSRPLVAIPGIFLGGAVFCMLCDLIARTMFAPAELNISTVTAVFGAPVVIAMLLKRQKGR